MEVFFISFEKPSLRRVLSKHCYEGELKFPPSENNMRLLSRFRKESIHGPWSARVHLQCQTYLMYILDARQAANLVLKKIDF